MGRTSSCESSATRHTGRVKWFNVKNGYGFITPVGNEEMLISNFNPRKIRSTNITL